MSVGENESIPVDPLGVLGVGGEEPLRQVKEGKEKERDQEGAPSEKGGRRERDGKLTWTKGRERPAPFPWELL